MKYNNIIQFVLLLITLMSTGLTSICISAPVSNSKQRILPLSEFIQLATSSDTVFEEILIDQLPLAYRRDTLLPSEDILVSIKHEYYFYLDRNRSNPNLTLSLNKLFPFTGTDVTLSYGKAASYIPNNENSELQLLIAQPIAKNAFGRGRKMQDQIIGIENDVVRYQIVEAYEDYLASLTSTYYNWYSAYENLKVGRASYTANLKLLDNIHKRQRQNIALPIDVNKMELLIIGKKESLISLQENYQNISNLIAKAIRYTGPAALTPAKPDQPLTDVVFERDYPQFTQTSRTYTILNLLEQQGTLEVKKAADDLLPSTNLLLGYRIEGKDWGIENQDDIVFAGFSFDWPFNNSAGKAQRKIAEIDRQKTVLSNQNKYQELSTNLKNLSLQITREKDLITIADEKIRLAELILKDEAENYSFGKVTLNDYIDAVNRVDENRFNRITHIVQLNKLLVEWLRLTDKLVDNNLVQGYEVTNPKNTVQ